MIIEISIAVIAICVVVLTIEKIIHEKILRDSAMYQFYATVHLTSDILEMFDDFIGHIFEEHIILKGDYSQIPYINSVEEENLRKEVIDKVSERISTTMYNQLSLHYNKDSIPTIIGEKIYELVALYVTQHNTSKPIVSK